MHPIGKETLPVHLWRSIHTLFASFVMRHFTERTNNLIICGRGTRSVSFAKLLAYAINSTQIIWFHVVVQRLTSIPSFQHYNSLVSLCDFEPNPLLIVPSPRNGISAKLIILAHILIVKHKNLSSSRLPSISRVMWLKHMGKPCQREI